MQHLRIPEPVKMCEIDGKPILRDGRPWLVTFREFLQGRLLDAKLAATADVAIAKRDMIKIVNDMPDKGGFVSFENEHHRYLLDVVNAPHPATGYPPLLVHNYVDFMLVVRAPLEKIPEEDEAAA